MYPTSMCGKPHPTSFRTLAHSGRVCRLLSEPETGSFLPCSGYADIVADQPAGPVHAIFGGVPRPTPRGVLDSSPYAYLEAVSLVLALVGRVFRISMPEIILDQNVRLGNALITFAIFVMSPIGPW